ncbi:MAG: S8 family serine peptidase [Candidatus Asgardarchaeia archaeon]
MHKKRFLAGLLLFTFLMATISIFNVPIESASPITTKVTPDVLNALNSNSDTVNLIVRVAGPANMFYRDFVHFGYVKYFYHIVDAVAISVKKSYVDDLARLSFVTKIELDAKVNILLDTATVDTNVVAVREELGYTGAGITIAIIDTGIDASHVALDDLDDNPDTYDPKVIAFKDFVNGLDDLDPSDGMDAYDDNGHGTHVAGIAAGTGAPDYKYVGVAPQAKLVGIKVLDDGGSGSTSDVIAGIEWAVDNKDTYGIKIISMSLGATVNPNDGTSSVAIAADKAVLAGIVTVIAAGNSGPAPGSISTPGDAHLVITVGAAYDSGEGTKGAVASFSSKGPTDDGRIKPDIVAPGVRIMAPEANTGTGYIEYSGTSMATPFVSGVVALILEANSALDPAEVKYILTRTTQTDLYSGYPDNTEGYGYIDAKAAVQLALQGVSLIDTVTTVVTDKTAYSSGLQRVYITVSVTDASGNPVAGAWVLIYVIASDGTLMYAEATQTDSSGTVTVDWRPGIRVSGSFVAYAISDLYYSGYHYSFGQSQTFTVG